jgi:hypothetical protein
MKRLGSSVRNEPSQPTQFGTFPNLNGSKIPGGLVTSSPSTFHFQHSSFVTTPRMNMYFAPPSHKVTMDEFERLGIARLHILRFLDNCSLKSLKDEVIMPDLEKIHAKNLPLHVNESSAAFDVEKERRDDLASHYILRLAMADNRDNIRWFVQNEVTLFR